MLGNVRGKRVCHWRSRLSVRWPAPAMMAVLIVIGQIAAQSGKRPEGFNPLPVDDQGVATSPIGQRFERAENMLKSACPDEAERAKRLRKKRQDGETGTNPDLDGHAGTKPNGGSGTAQDPWKWEHNDPSNTVQLNEDQFTSSGEYNPADVGPAGQPGPSSDAAQDVMLSSVLLHEDVHCNQDGTKQDGVPMNKQAYKNEAIAHEKQIAYVGKATAWCLANNIIEPNSAPHKKLRYYESWLQGELNDVRRGM